MRERKLYEKKRAKKGTGRAKTIPVQVSAELHDELSLIKAAYSRCLSQPVTFEQMLRRWIDRLSRIDADVNDEYQVIRKTRLETEAGAASTAKEAVSGIFKRMQGNGTSLMEEAMKEQEEAKAALEEDLRASAGDSSAPAEDKVQSPEPEATPEVPVDPTEGEVWEMRYFFERDGEEIEAYTGYRPGFYAQVDDQERDQKEMMADGWVLMNEAGIEISPDHANQISIIINSHMRSETNANTAMKKWEEAEAAFEEDLHASVGDSPATAEDQGSPEPDVPQEGKKRWQEDYWFIDTSGNKVKAVIKTVKGIRSFFPEKSSSASRNFRTLMVREHWKMVDERGNEVSFQVAQQVLQEFEANHE